VRLEHFAHAAHADTRDNFVRAETVTRERHRRRLSTAVPYAGRTLEMSSGSRRPCQF
jgi:hypothetical protein